MSEKLLDVKDLKVEFNTEEGTFNAINGISFEVRKGETLGIVGESGCGKSVTSLSIMRLIPSPPGKIIGGSINYKKQDLIKLRKKEMQKIRGNDIAMIFQEPMTSLNPALTIGDQISEVIQHHESLSHKQALSKSINLLDLVGISEAERRVKEYPHQLSGGMRQRIVIAMALACNPELLIADEPTTALDVTIQAQILDLMKEMKEKFGMSIIFITHDLGVVSEIADSVMVMYAGEVMEKSSADKIFKEPMHPYTQGLINSVPDVNDDREHLESIQGSLPHFSDMPKGCRFSTRCPYAKELCINRKPELEEQEEDHFVRCWKYTKQWYEGDESSYDSTKRTTVTG